VKALVFAAGAQGRITVEILRALGRWSSIAFIDDDASASGREILGVKVIGTPESVEERGAYEVVVALGHPEVRLAVAERLAGLGFRFLTAVHPSAHVAPSAIIGEGTVVCPGAIIHTEARVGVHVIVNTGAIVEHDADLADGACVSPRVLVSGRTKIGRGSFLGIGSMVLPRVSVGAGAVVGATSVVTSDVRDRSFVVGTPARLLGAVDAEFDWSRLF
jgi:sugar O-acyltransferase (sialic acid O-acetyltransferase NeuD family)